MSTVVSPLAASFCHDRRNNPLLDGSRLLHEVDVETRANVPGNVAVERPDARIVRVVLNHHVTRADSAVSVTVSRLQDLHVAPLGVLDVGDGSIPCTDAFGEDVEVVAVEMHGVRGGDFILHDETDAVVGAEVVNIPLGVIRIGGISHIGE